jgi:glycosyltransferase involved in cell wall biosynthesis
MIKFSIVITTKNRCYDLLYTLNTLEEYVIRKDVELLICDDASTDDTVKFLKQFYSEHTLIFNKKSQGLIANRNTLNNLAKGAYIISLDDDANFISDNVLDEIEKCFVENPKCAVQALSIYWGLHKINVNIGYEKPSKSKGFVGCGHAWRKTIWNTIPKYPAWFVFYGEEDYASYQVLKYGFDVLYNPNILVQHRVDVKSRKKNKDYRLRLRRSLRSGWYLYVLFYPIKEIPKRFIYTLWIQIKNKILKGDLKATIAIIQAFFDLLLNLPRLVKNANRFSSKEFKEYQNLPNTVLYWKPKEE